MIVSGYGGLTGDIARRRLGNTALEVTTLGFGGAPLGSIGTRLDEADADAIVRLAFEGGVRYFDTAPLYGHGLSEKRLGRVLATLPRDDFVLSTKIGRLLVPEAEGERHAGMRDAEPHAIRYDYSYDAVQQSLASSLDRLGLDRIDVLLCHDIDVWTHGAAQPGVYAAATEGALRALTDLRGQGVIGAFGLGVNEAKVCVDIINDGFEPNCFLLAGRFTLLEQDPLDEMLPLCVARGVSVIIGGPYNSGLLATADRQRATYDYKPVDDERWARAQEIRRVCDAHGVDVRAAALQYPLRHPAVAAVIPGARSAAEEQDNLRLIDVAVPDALWRELAAAGLARWIDG